MANEEHRRPVPKRDPAKAGPTYMEHFGSDVFWWEPDGRVVRISPGDGVYLMACVHPDGQGAVFWGGARGRPRLWWSDGAGEPEPLTSANVSARYPAFSLAGEHLAYCCSTEEHETIEHIERSNASARPPHSTRMQVVVRRTTDGTEWPLTDGTTLDERPALSPDGTQVVFVSNRNGRHGLWQVATSGGEPRPLLPGRKAYRPWWSPDGARIYFFLLGRDRHRIHSIDVEHGGVPVPLASDDLGNTHGPYVDPGGEYVLAHSTREAETRPSAWWGLYEFPLDGGTPRRLEPPGHVRGAHVTRARNGVTTFDVSRRVASG